MIVDVVSIRDRRGETEPSLLPSESIAVDSRTDIGRGDRRYINGLWMV